MLLILGIIIVVFKFIIYLLANIPSFATIGFIIFVQNLWWLWIVGFVLIVYTFFKNIYILGGVILVMTLLMYLGGMI